MKILLRITIFLIFLSLLAGIIAYARGYRLDLKNQNLTSTGIVAVSAFPKASKVFVNGELKGVSDINLTLPPGSYEIEVKKDGYTSWKKSVRLKGELVLSLDALLYPLNPSLSPLTNISIVKAEPIPHSNKLILFSENEDETKDGIYLFEESPTLAPFFSPLKLIALKKNLVPKLGQFTLLDTEVEISPDAKEGLFTFSNSTGTFSYLLSLDEENLSFFDITNSRETLTEAWNRQIEEVNLKILEAFPDEINKVASDSFQVIEFSPDETKLLYKARQNTEIPQAVKPLIATNQTPEVRNIKTDSLYVYDKKEDRNYKIDAATNLIPISWYSDSKHLVMNEGKKISFLDFDNQNKRTVYSGIFDGNFFKVSSDGKILLLINLNPENNRFPDLYAVGIR